VFTGNQKVVLIDNDYKEIEPLLQALSKLGVSYTYLDGKQENLPDEPFSGVRLVFLDIELDGIEGASEKNMASALMGRLQRILGSEPGPYFIIFWTKHSDQMAQVLANLKSINTAPVGYLDFEKPTSSDAVKTVPELLDKIKTEFKTLNAFNYLLAWEKCIENSMSDFSNTFFGNVVSDGNLDTWSQDILSLLGKLSHTQSGTNNLQGNADDLKNAFLMLSNSFCDTIQRKILTDVTDVSSGTLSKTDLTLEKVAKMNTSLFIGVPSNHPAFGSVFIETHNSHLREALEHTVFPNSAKPGDVRVVGMIITPSCDLAHKKYLQSSKDPKDSKDCFRIIYGLMTPVSNYDDTMKYLQPEWLDNKKNDLLKELDEKGVSSKSRKIAKKHFQKWTQPESIFLMNPFVFEDKPHMIVFHFGSLSSCWWGADEYPAFVFAIKEHLAFDIQSKMASHANRLGNTMLSP